MPDDFEPPGDLALVDEEADIADDEDIHFVVDTDSDDLIEERGEPARWQLRSSFASVFLVLLAALQFAWFGRDRFALEPDYRDAYLVACRSLPCDLPGNPATRAPSKVSGLVIRSHPNRENALKVDALLTNNARWRQAFPALRLRFSDLGTRKSRPGSSGPRSISAGEMAGLRYRPGQTGGSRLPGGRRPRGPRP
ncbi:MAG: DUF3426 domain-containing protein [Gammaproteobacteria bacterium]|nr:DUF3426 domain-containing protein [Gammaproteobacteria bacterium]